MLLLTAAVPRVNMGENTAAEQNSVLLVLHRPLCWPSCKRSRWLLFNHTIDGESAAVWQHLCFPCAAPTCFVFALLNYFWYAPADIFLEMEVSQLNGKYSITHVSYLWSVSAGGFQPWAIKGRIITIHRESNSHFCIWYWDHVNLLHHLRCSIPAQNTPIPSDFEAAVLLKGSRSWVFWYFSCVYVWEGQWSNHENFMDSSGLDINDSPFPLVFLPWKYWILSQL